jgi:PAS domain S-box-containing protein
MSVQRMKRWRILLFALAGIATAAGAWLWWWSVPRPPATIIRVGYRHYPPYYYATAGNHPHGMAVEVISQAAERQGIPLEWKQITGTSEDALVAGEIDLWPTLTARPGRNSKVRLGEPWLLSEYFLLLRRDGPVHTAADASTRRIASIPRWAERELLGHHCPRATIVETDSSAHKLEALCEGGADAAFVEGREAQELLLDRPTSCSGVAIDFVRVPGAAWPHSIGTMPAQAAVADRLRREIERMGEDGRLSRILANWAFTTTNETQVVYALRRARVRSRTSLLVAAGLACILAVLLWEVRRARRAHRAAETASRAMRDYARQQERYRLLVERNLAGVMQVAMDGGIVDCNDAAARMFGYANRADLIGHNAGDLYFDAAERQAILERLRQAGSLTSEEGDLKRRDGSVVHVIRNLSLIETDGEPPIVESTLLDLTAHRQLEERYRQAQKLESVGQLAGGVAHDFNNLLTAINGYAELAMQETPAASDVREYLEEIGHAGRQAASLTQQLLAFSRKQILQPEVLDLNAVLTGALKLLRRVIGEHIEIVTDLADAVGHVRADRGQLLQVVLNLAVNARDAMPDGGRLQLATRDVVLDDEAGAEPDALSGEVVRLTIADNGHGMHEETRRRAFEPFFTTKERGKGTGLGLATVYGIVKQSGGHIRVRSAPGEGTVFEIDLPRVEEPAAAEAPEQASPTVRSAGTILLAEDQDEVRRLAAESLERAGYEVLAAPDGTAALALWRAHSRDISLVVADVIMPGMTGVALVQALRAEVPSVKVLLISGYADHPLPADLLAGGQIALLGKPFTPTGLVARVQRMIDAGPSPA